MRSTLVAALASSAEGPRKIRAKRFLTGLSCDELQFIAEYLGAAILDSSDSCACSRPELAERISEFQRLRLGPGPSRDQDHKTILLLEFLCRCGLSKGPASVRHRYAQTA